MLGDDNEFEQHIAKVVGFVEATALRLDLPLDVRGTAFQQQVWQALREISVGAIVTYTDIAHRIGSPKSVSAVARNLCCQYVGGSYSLSSGGEK